MPKSLREINELALSYEIPFEDVLFIDLNRQGVITDIDYERLRFYFKIPENSYFKESKELNIRKFFFAVPTRSGISNYYLKNNAIYLGNEKIGEVSEFENDTCESVYPRRNGTVFNLNTQSKSNCRGCAFCHTFKQTAKDIYNFNAEKLIEMYIENWLGRYYKPDLSHLNRVDVVTGCFGGEGKVLNHLFQVRNIFSKYNFQGEIFYFGSEITSEEGFKKLEKIKPFALCLSLECFENRDKLLRAHKAKISLEHAKEILNISKERGFGTHFSYILGLEPLDIVIEKMKKFLPYINRIPVINLFQPHTDNQNKLIIKDAINLEYFLKARKKLEKIFLSTGYRPRTWGNYRCLWYLKFGNEILYGSRLP